jgi:hypothetical protein
MVINFRQVQRTEIFVAVGGFAVKVQRTVTLKTCQDSSLAKPFSCIGALHL